MNICVYGASSSVIAKSYINPVEELGAKMAERGHSLVYGGGANGLMGAVARGVHSKGGKITGIAPSFFNVDGALYPNCTDFVYPDNMRDRKKIMEDLSDAFIVTPGGPGTLDEFFEILTLRQLGRHTKPIAVFNIGGYYDDLIAMLKNAVRRQFMTEATLKLCLFTDNLEKLLSYIEGYQSDPTDIGSFKYIK